MTTPTPSTDELLLVGTIVAAFGVNGIVKMKSYTDRPDHLARRVRTLYVGKNRTPMRLLKLHQHKPGLFLLTLEGVSDRDAADDLRSSEVYILEREAAPLAEGEYFLHQLVGLHVLTEAGESVGKVREILETGAGEILIVQREGQADALIPMVQQFIVNLDLAGGQIVIRPIEGLL